MREKQRNKRLNCFRISTASFGYCKSMGIENFINVLGLLKDSSGCIFMFFSGHKFETFHKFNSY